ncbi:MAG: GGDEF domain-containing protein [Candidatus Cohnella colombiensis]|uniref:GGDEF domain-containing protein n=1 Tax=Candidatus Cohnella colombiensis TaxID=3121368 RepID=A0AA95EXR2_9BACL|nr:MAG: GGDEF domain-containing protein [Cohnella sp.]
MDIPLLTSNDIILLLTSAMSIMIVTFILFMAYRLLSSNRKQAYRTLLISLSFILIQQFLHLSMTLGLTPRNDYLLYTEKLLQVLAFIVINFAIFELYYRIRPRTRLWFIVLLGSEFIACILDIVNRTMESISIEVLTVITEFRAPIQDGLLLLLGPLFMLMFAPHIGQPRKYMISLVIVSLAQLLSIFQTYWFENVRWLTNFSEILPVIYYGLLFMLVFERVVELLQAVYRSSITDGLTNLFNRRYFMSRLEKAVLSKRPLGTIFCDIDNFKRLNDTHGHAKADTVLKQVANIMSEETEGMGLAGRYGGEELVAFVFGPNTAIEHAAEAIRRRTEKETIVTISVGICQASPGIAPEQLMSNADQAMYSSKANGKNRVTTFTI